MLAPVGIFNPNPPIPPFDVMFAGWATPYPNCPTIASASYLLDQQALMVRYNDNSLDIFQAVPQGVGQATSTLACLETYFAQAIKQSFVPASTQVRGVYRGGTALIELASAFGISYGTRIGFVLRNGERFVTTISAPPAGLPRTWVTISPALPSPVASGALVTFNA